MGTRVLFFCPDRHIRYDGATPDRVGVGGGVTARIRLAAALARLGHQVTLQVNCAQRGIYEGVTYLPLGEDPPREVEVLVANSTGGDLDLAPVGALPTRAQLRQVWIGGKARLRGLDQTRYQSLVVPSNFMRRVIVQEWGLPASRVLVAYNGVEEANFLDAGGSSGTRDPYRLAYLGHPAKGLEAALAIHRRLRQLDGRFTLHVYGGERLWGEAEKDTSYGEGVVFHGLLGQESLAQELLQCSFALHLQAIEEAFGISMAESMRAGCVVIASPVGAFPELIRDGWNAFLLPGDHLGRAVQDQAVDLIRKLVASPDQMTAIRQCAQAWSWTWDRVARVWAGYWDWKLGRSGPGWTTSREECTQCRGRLLLLADGPHCTRCGLYIPDLVRSNISDEPRGSGLPSAGSGLAEQGGGSALALSGDRPATASTEPLRPRSTRAGWLRQVVPEGVRRTLARLRDRVRDRRDAGKIAAWQSEVAAIRARHSGREVILFAPGLLWDRQLFQRPQQLARALANAGALVFYMLPQGGGEAAGIAEHQERLYLCGVPPSVFDVLEEPAIYVLAWNVGCLSRFKSRRVVYDVVDDLEVFQEAGRSRVLRDHRSMLRQAALVLATSRDLFERVRKERADVVLCPNAVDYEHFSRIRRASREPPEDMRPIVGLGRPIVGYYGALARWFDYDLVGALAGLRPDLSFVLIGPDHDGTLPSSPMLRLPHVHWLGVKPYDALPQYLQCFDVAAIPFKVNAVTHAVSPLKLFEYMAGGKPVIVTPMRESMQTEGVLVADGPQEFSLRIDEALRLRRDPDYLDRIDRAARANTWAKRAETILSSLRGVRLA